MVFVFGLFVYTHAFVCLSRNVLYDDVCYVCFPPVFLCVCVCCIQMCLCVWSVNKCVMLCALAYLLGIRGFACVG